MSRGGVGLRIIGFARAAFGFMAGGLGMVVVGASMIFGGISGSAIADSAAIGSVMIKNMSREATTPPSPPVWWLQPGRSASSSHHPFRC